MKNARAIIPIAFAVVISLWLTSCEITTTSIMDRLTLFATDLNNSDRTNAYLNFDSVDTDYYAAIRDPGWWGGNGFPVVGTGELAYSFVISSYSDPLNVTGDMYGPPSFSGSGLPRPVRLVMIKTGTAYFIHELYLDDSTTATIRSLK